MLIQQWRRPAHAHRRERQTHGRARRLVLADHRMLEILQPFAHPVLSAIDKLAYCIQRRGGQMARLCLVGEIIGIELTNEVGERLGDFSAC